MGLDSTIYIAAKNWRPEYGAKPMDNPYAPEPPEGMEWWVMFYWRKHYVLDAALATSMGNPAWNLITLPLLRKTQAKMLMHWTGTGPLGYVLKHKAQDMRFIVWARSALIAGETLLYERAT